MGFLHIWTTTFRWRVSYETASVSRSAGQLLVFLINDSLNFFLKFYIKLEGLKSRKLTELKFSKKFLRWGKSPNFLENVFLAFAKNLIHWYIFYPKIAQTVVFMILQKSHACEKSGSSVTAKNAHSQEDCKMLWSSYISGKN